MNLKKKLLHLSALTIMCLLYLVMTGSAFARSGVCASREVVISRLAEKFKETRQSMGLGANNQLMELFASDESGTWTIIVTLPNGQTCLIASGQAFEALQEALPANAVDA